LILSDSVRNMRKFRRSS